MQYPALLVAALGVAWKFKYPLIFLGMIVEGPIIMVATGFFLRFGVFSLIPLYLTLVIGDLTADVMWYYIGYHFAEPLIIKHGRFLGITPEVFEKVKKLLHERQTLILLGSKVTIGFGLALGIVVTAGVTKVPFRKFLFLNIIGEFVQVAILMSLGYFFGHFYTIIGKGFKELFLAAGILFFGAIIFGFTRYIKSRTLKI